MKLQVCQDWWEAVSGLQESGKTPFHSYQQTSPENESENKYWSCFGHKPATLKLFLFVILVIKVIKIIILINVIFLQGDSTLASISQPADEFTFGHAGHMAIILGRYVTCLDFIIELFGRYRRELELCHMTIWHSHGWYDFLLFRNEGEQTKPGLFENIKEKAKSGFSATKRNFLWIFPSCHQDSVPPRGISFESFEVLGLASNSVFLTCLAKSGFSATEEQRNFQIFITKTLLT